MNQRDEIGSNIRRLRQQNRLTQLQLANMAGLDVTTISRIESPSFPSLHTLVAIAQALKVNVAELTAGGGHDGKNT